MTLIRRALAKPYELLHVTPATQHPETVTCDICPLLPSSQASMLLVKLELVFYLHTGWISEEYREAPEG